MSSFKLIVLLILAQWSWALTYTTSDASFTDSQGQTAKYRIGIPDNYVPGTEVDILIHLHGNNSGTQDDMLNMWYNTTENRADNNGLIPIVVASPGTRSDGVTRQWSEDLDPQMLDELIKSNFGNRINVNHDGVYLWGSSQGTCFINAFLLAKSDEYLGGALGNCGCFNYLSNDFKPSQSFIDNYKFYILGTTGDFLYEPSKNGYQFYRWTAGLKNIRGDIERPGAHCTAPGSAVDSALAWLVGDITIPETPDEVHWQRVSVLDTVISMQMNSFNEVIAGIYNNNQSKVVLSDDQGDTWDEVITLPSEKILSVFGGDSGDILILTESKFYRYNSLYQLQSEENVQFDKFDQDSQGNIFRYGPDGTEVSINGGLDWVSTGLGSVESASVGQEFLDTQAAEIIVKPSWNSYATTNANGDENTISLPSQNLNFFHFTQHQGIILLYGWDYNDNWKPYAWTTTDRGTTWTPVTLPAGFTLGYTGHAISFYHDGSLMYHGSGTTYLSSDNGATWVEEVNLGSLSFPVLTVDAEGIAYASNGQSIFRRQAWLSSDQRPVRSLGEQTTSLAGSIAQSAKIAQGAQIQRYPNLLIINSQSQTSVRAINAQGQTQTLFEGNPQGKATISLESLSRGTIIEVRDLQGQRTQFIK